MIHSQIKKELIDNERMYNDYEEYPYILDLDITNNIEYLYANIQTIPQQESEKIMSITETYIHCLEEKGQNPFYIKCKLLLLDVLRLFVLDGIKNGISEHIFQCKFGELIADTGFDRDILEDTIILIATVIPNLRSILYYYESNVYVYVDEAIQMSECKDFIIKGNYYSAYDKSIDILTNLFEKEQSYFNSIPTYTMNHHREWIKKKFNFCLKLASIIDKVDDLQKRIIRLPTINSISKEDINLKTRGDVEKFCSNHIDSFQKGFDVTIRNFFERFEREKCDNNSEYVCNMKYLYQKVLSKIIEEDSTMCENEFINSNKRVIQLCDDGINSINLRKKTPYVSKRDLILEKEFAEKRLLSRIWLWNSYNVQEKEIVIDEILNYNGNCQIINNFRRTLNLVNTLNKSECDITINSLFDRIIELTREITYLEKRLYIWNYDNDYTFYTTLRTFSFLLLDESERIPEKRNRLSLMNSDYMNDPNEGNVFFDVCREEIKRNCNNSIFKRLVHETGKKIRKCYNNNSLVFLKSFSNKIDKLTMWSEYGDKGKGCCIVVDGNTFKMTKQKLEIIHNLDKENHLDINDEFGLYNILYWNSKKNEFILNGNNCEFASNHIKKIMEHIGQICTYAENLSNDSVWVDEIINIIHTIVMKISFLIKYDEYQDEEESRIILLRNTHSKSNDIETIPNEIETLKSMLYIHYPLKTQIKEIILGPKVLDADYYAPFILKKISEVNSGIFQKTKLSISSIDYR